MNKPKMRKFGCEHEGFVTEEQYDAMLAVCEAAWKNSFDYADGDYKGLIEALNFLYPPCEHDWHYYADTCHGGPIHRYCLKCGEKGTKRITQADTFKYYWENHNEETKDEGVAGSYICPNWKQREGK